MLYSVLLWRQLGYRKLEIVTYPLMVGVVLVLIITRVHYAIDIVGGVVFALWINRFVLAKLAWFDYLFTCIYRVIMQIIAVLRASVS